MSKMQCNQIVVLSEGNKLDICLLNKDFFKKKTNKGKFYKGNETIWIQEQGIANEDIVKIVCLIFHRIFKKKL
jgi:hypothetical protein